MLSADPLKLQVLIPLGSGYQAKIKGNLDVGSRQRPGQQFPPSRVRQQALDRANVRATKEGGEADVVRGGRLLANPSQSLNLRRHSLAESCAQQYDEVRITSTFTLEKAPDTLSVTVQHATCDRQESKTCT
eukprot:RCo010206